MSRFSVAIGLTGALLLGCPPVFSQPAPGETGTQTLQLGEAPGETGTPSRVQIVAAAPGETGTQTLQLSEAPGETGNDLLRMAEIGEAGGFMTQLAQIAPGENGPPLVSPER